MITRLILSTALITVFAGCSKDVAVKDLNFDVTASKKDGTLSDTYALTDTLNFSFSGNPDIITFYSGETGHRYEYKDRTAAVGTPVLQFTSLRANGTQANSLSVLVSTDFAGLATKSGSTLRDTAATSANLASANWTDLTSKATLSTGSSTVSGNIDLSDVASAEKPVYIAFKYKASTGTIQNKWTISALSVTNTLSDGTAYTIANLNAPTTAITNYFNTSYSPGWTVFFDQAVNANQYAWVYTAGTSLVITGASTAATATASSESWAIMGPLSLRKVTPDIGVGLKSIASKLDNYSYRYTSANNGKITFVASNNTVDESSQKVKELGITVK